MCVFEVEDKSIPDQTKNIFGDTVKYQSDVTETVAKKRKIVSDKK